MKEENLKTFRDAFTSVRTAVVRLAYRRNASPTLQRRLNLQIKSKHSLPISWTLL